MQTWRKWERAWTAASAAITAEKDNLNGGSDR